MNDQETSRHFIQRIIDEDNLSGISYYNSTKELFEKPINHQLSLRINYFIDFKFFYMLF